MHVADPDLMILRDLYGQGRYRAAYDHARTLGPFEQWSNTPARVMAGRLAMQLGAPRLGRLLHIRAGRADPRDPEATYYLARAIFEARGPYPCWQFLRRHGELTDAPSDIRADWFSLMGFTLCRLRDFDRAERFQNRAEELAPTSPWLAVERAALLEGQERLDEALGQARRALELKPWFRPGVQAAAHLLQLLRRDQEALDLLTEADRHLESSLVVAQLSALQHEMGRYADARRSLDRFAELTPLLESKGQQWLAGRRCDAAYFLGERAEALELARAAGDLPFFEHLTKHLAAAPEQVRASRLEVNTVRRSSDDASPASSILTALARYWNQTDPTALELPPDPIMPPGQLGLPDVRERAWAEANGLLAIEFTVSAANLADLIDRGVPFALTSIEAGFMASIMVTGYDQGRGSFFFRDAAAYSAQEAILEAFLERYRSTGPRGLVLLPPDQASRLDGIEFTDREHYDRLHRLQTCLVNHDRPAATREAEALASEAPGHRLALAARLALARFDANPLAMLLALDALLANHPNDFTFQLARSTCLRELGRRDERLALLRRMSALPDGGAVFGPHLAQALVPTPREAGRAAWLLRRTIRHRPLLSAGYVLLGNLMWDDGRRDQALDLYRFAACLDDRDELLSQTYTRAARALGQVPEALRFLQARLNRLGPKSSLPARLLAATLLDLDQPRDMFSALGRALQNHPTDGELLVFAARQRTAFSEHDEADDLLARAQGKASDSTWRRAAADIALERAEPLKALSMIRPLAEAEPLNLDLQRSVVRLIIDTDGRPAAQAYLRSLVTRFPEHLGLAHLWAETLRGEPPAAAEPILTSLVAAFPEDPWLRRESALHLADLGNYDAALAELGEARRLEPISPSTAAVTGRVYSLAGRTADARAAYREALRQSIDTEIAMTELIALAPDEDTRRQELVFIEQELIEQAHSGEGVFAYRNLALPVLDPDQVIESLQDIHDAQPRLWQTWSVLVNQYGMLGRFDEARTMAEEAVELFPLLPQIWLDLAHVHEAQEDDEAAIEAMREALRAMPGWGPAARELSEILERSDNVPEALEVLRLAIARTPLDPATHGYLADALWRADQPQEALNRVEHALRLDPGYEWAWRTLAEWADRSEDRGRVAQLARDITSRRPGDARAWLALVRVLNGPDHTEEVLQALDHAIELDPRQVEAYDLKGERLAEAGRFEEALAACRAAIGVAFDPPRPTPPLNLSNDLDNDEDEEDDDNEKSELLPPPRREGVPLPGDQSPEPDLPFILQGRVAWIEAKRGNFAAAIPRMQALVAIEPGYYWGWQQLADWYNETGRTAAYLEAASELVRLRPESPVALARRGEARLQSGDRANGKADLRQSQQLAPDYAFAGMALFDAHFADSEYDDANRALAILQEHLSDDLVLARQVQLLVKQGERERAGEVLGEIASNGSMQAYSQFWPLQTAVNAMREAGWDDDVDTILLGATYDSTFHPLAALSWSEGPAGQASPLADRVAALERATLAHPHYLPGHDAKAELLARHGSFDDALRACHPPALGPVPPVLLRGRAAWVRAQKGDLKDAIRQMRNVVESEPDYHWGWRQLAQWCDTVGDTAGYREAAENLVRLAPRDPEAFGYRAEARLQIGDRDGAKADFRQAFQLDPRYGFAGLNLFDKLLEDGEIEDAAEALAQLKSHADGPLVSLRAVRLEVKRGDQGAAEAAFREICADHSVTPLVIQRAADEMNSAVVDRILAETLPDPAAGPAVGRVWVERSLSAGRWEVLDRLDSLVDRGELGRQALQAAVEALGQPDRLPRLRDLIAHHAQALRDNSVSWANVGIALAAAGADKDAADWMAGWAEREDVEPWMLLEFSMVLRRLGRSQEALDVNRHAAELPGDDDSGPAHAAWVGLMDVLSGRTGDRWLIAKPEELDQPFRFVAEVTWAVRAVAQAKPGQRTTGFADARRRLAEAVRSHGSVFADPVLKQIHNEVVRRIAAHVGGLRGWLWSLLHRLG